VEEEMEKEERTRRKQRSIRRKRNGLWRISTSKGIKNIILLPPYLCS
jgi:hypothetical protein